MLQLSLQLQEHIIAWHYEQNKTALEIAELTGCCEHTVYNVLQSHNEFGQVTNPYA
jgi:transposase